MADTLKKPNQTPNYRRVLDFQLKLGFYLWIIGVWSYRGLINFD